MNRSLFLSALLTLLVFPSIGQSANRDSAIGALNSLPPVYRNGVVWLSADHASPHPDRWYAIARNAARRGQPMDLTIARGRIISERPARNPRAFSRQLSPINLRSIRVNSPDLWRTADRLAANRGRRLGSMSLQLQRQGPHASPFWSVWCYDRRGRYIGFFSALATTGAVTSSRW
jgi:hypothetical protein